MSFGRSDVQSRDARNEAALTGELASMLSADMEGEMSAAEFDPSRLSFFQSAQGEDLIELCRDKLTQILHAKIMHCESIGNTEAIAAMNKLYRGILESLRREEIYKWVVRGAKLPRLPQIVSGFEILCDAKIDNLPSKKQDNIVFLSDARARA